MVQQNIIEDNFERPGGQEARQSKTEHTKGGEKEARLYLKQMIDDNLLESASSRLSHRVSQTKGSREPLSDLRSRRCRATDCRGRLPARTCAASTSFSSSGSLRTPLKSITSSAAVGRSTFASSHAEIASGVSSEGCSISTSPSAAKRSARMSCSVRGSVLGTTSAGLRYARISQIVLYPAIATTRSARSRRGQGWVTNSRTCARGCCAASDLSEARDSAGMRGPVTTTPVPGFFARRNASASVNPSLPPPTRHRVIGLEPPSGSSASKSQRSASHSGSATSSGFRYPVKRTRWAMSSGKPYSLTVSYTLRSPYTQMRS